MNHISSCVYVVAVVLKAAIKLHFIIHRIFLFLKYHLLFPGSIVKEDRKKLKQFTLFNWSFVPSHISVTDDLTIWGICLLWVIKRKVCQVTRTWLTFKKIEIVALYSLCNLKLNLWHSSLLLCSAYNLSYNFYIFLLQLEREPEFMIQMFCLIFSIQDGRFRR